MDRLLLVIKNSVSSNTWKSRIPFSVCCLIRSASSTSHICSFNFVCCGNNNDMRFCERNTYVISINYTLYYYKIIQSVPLPTKPGISLIILKPMKILQWDLNRRTFIVWEMKRNVSVVRLVVVTRNSGPPASQPVFCLTRLSLAEGAYTIRLLFVSVVYSVSSHRIVGKCIGILWRSECLLSALIGKQNR